MNIEKKNKFVGKGNKSSSTNKFNRNNQLQKQKENNMINNKIDKIAHKYVTETNSLKKDKRNEKIEINNKSLIKKTDKSIIRNKKENNSKKSEKKDSKNKNNIITQKNKKTKIISLKKNKPNIKTIKKDKISPKNKRKLEISKDEEKIANKFKKLTILNDKRFSTAHKSKETLSTYLETISTEENHKKEKENEILITEKENDIIKTKETKIGKGNKNNNKKENINKIGKKKDNRTDKGKKNQNKSESKTKNKKEKEKVKEKEKGKEIEKEIENKNERIFNFDHKNEKRKGILTKLHKTEKNLPILRESDKLDISENKKLSIKSSKMVFFGFRTFSYNNEEDDEENGESFAPGQIIRRGKRLSTILTPLPLVKEKDGEKFIDPLSKDVEKAIVLRRHEYNNLVRELNKPKPKRPKPKPKPKSNPKPKPKVYDNDKIIEIQKRYKGFQTRTINQIINRLKVNLCVTELCCLILKEVYIHAKIRISFCIIKLYYHDPFANIDDEVDFSDKLYMKLSDKYYNFNNFKGERIERYKKIKKYKMWKKKTIKLKK